MTSSPYITGDPVGGGPAFVGRSDILRAVLRMLERPAESALVLFGQRRIGKTSVLLELERRLPAAGPYRPLYLDMQDKGAWTADTLAEDLAIRIALDLGLRRPGLGDDAGRRFAEEWLPKALSALPDDGVLVLLVDEFDALEDGAQGVGVHPGAAPLMRYLRALMTRYPQRLAFVFVLGRNIDDLASEALSVLKGVRTRRVGLLPESEARELVCLSQRASSLSWSNPAVDRAWRLSRGHPFLTQMLASVVWEGIVLDGEETPAEVPRPPVSQDQVDAAVPETLEAARSSLEWLWTGLNPAHRVVASALASAGPGSLTRAELDKRLQDSGVRVLVRELRIAPEDLVEWGLLEPVGTGWRFQVELLRRWVETRKPLHRAQQELDRLEPQAQAYFKVAQEHHRARELSDCVAPLRKALGLNPNHLGASELLAEVLISLERFPEAVEVLRVFETVHPKAAKPLLVQALLAMERLEPDEDERLVLLAQVSELEPELAEAQRRRSKLVEAKAGRALEQGHTDEYVGLLGQVANSPSAGMKLLAATEGYRSQRDTLQGELTELAAENQDVSQRLNAAALVKVALESERQELASRLEEERVRAQTANARAIELEEGLAQARSRALMSMLGLALVIVLLGVWLATRG